MILLRQNLKGMQLLLRSYKLLQEMDQWFLKQGPGCGYPNIYPSTFILHLNWAALHHTREVAVQYTVSLGLLLITWEDSFVLVFHEIINISKIRHEDFLRPLFVRPLSRSG